jgi:uncharacterized protein YbjT (DUF2867 family)
MEANQEIRAIITGTTGMVGEGVLHECLLNPQVTDVLIINRRPSGIAHPKLKEIIQADFFDMEAIAEQLAGYNACFFCLGVSSVGMKEPVYTYLTYNLTLYVAGVLSKQNPDMTFCYVSGAGTDSSEKGRSMWARVKGRTENDLLKLPFKHMFAFRPGYMHPTKGLKNVHDYYKYLRWLYPVGRTFFPGAFCSLRELGQAMIHVAQEGNNKPILEGRDIIRRAK